MTWFGNLGDLHKLRGTAKQTRTGGIVHNTWELAAGGRHAQVGVTRRIWALESSGAVTPQDLSAIESHYYGAFGPGPFYYVAPDAVGTNLVTPWDSLMGSASHALASPAPSHYSATGGQTMPDGTVVPGGIVRVDVPDPPQRVGLTSTPIPCPPGGGKVTISAWVSADPSTDGAHLIVWWADSTGAPTEGGPSSVAVTGTEMQRVSLTFQTDGTKPGFFIYGESYALAYAGVAATWTDDVYPYVVGRGCDSAVLEPASLDTVLAVAGTKGWGRYDTSSYQVREVG